MSKVPSVIVVGDLVALNTLLDAQWFEVLSVSGYFIGIRQPRDPGMIVEYAAQIVDRSLIKQHRSRSSLEQVGYRSRVWLSEQNKWSDWTLEKKAIGPEYPNLKIEDEPVYVFSKLPT